MDRRGRPGTLARAALAAGALGLGTLAAHAAPERNGFELAPASVPTDEILRGGPARDGIPALTDPKVVPAGSAGWDDEDRVLGVEVAGEARAYPIGILNWHELVNDTLGGRPLLVSYCPLCGTGMVFDRRVEGEVRRFGVSGLLYRSDVLMYDRESESLWSQIEAEAVVGPSLGTRLELVRSEMARYGDWRARHPETTVLSRETGHRRNYDHSPYGGYAESERLHFPAPVDPRYHPKMPTLGLRLPDGPARGYPAEELVSAGGAVEERFAGHSVRVAYDPKAQTFRVDAPEEIEVVEGYWFAWAAFHSETSVFTSSSDAGGAGAGDERP